MKKRISIGSHFSKCKGCNHWMAVVPEYSVSDPAELYDSAGQLIDTIVN